jgi:hypothetical protein
MTTPGPSPSPTLRKVPKPVLYLGAAAAGFIAFSYWNRTRTPTTPAPSTADTSLPDPTLPTVTTTTVPDNSSVIATNAEWTKAAVDYLSQQSNGGWNPQFISTALGHFLARRGLTSDEQDVVLAALAAFGQPPQNAPFNVLSAPTPTNPPGGATVGHHYMVETHTVGTPGHPASVRAVVQRFSDHEVATPNNIETALRATVNDHANAKFIKYYTGTGMFPGGSIAHIHVVKKG